MPDASADPHADFPEELELEALRLCELPPAEAQPALRKLVLEQPAHAAFIEALG